MSGKIKHQKLNFYHLCIHARKCFWFTNKECLTQHCSPSTWHYTISFGFYVNILYHIRRREISYWDHIFWFYGSFWNFKLFHYTDTFHFFCKLVNFLFNIWKRRRTVVILSSIQSLFIDVSLIHLYFKYLSSITIKYWKIKGRIFNIIDIGNWNLVMNSILKRLYLITGKSKIWQHWQNDKDIYAF